MPIKPTSAKAKGRLLQQWVCQQISDLLGIPWGKDELIASREASQTGTDIRLVGEARERFPFSVECKSQETWNVPAWIKQAKQNQMEGTDWLLVMKRRRVSPVVVMDAKSFFQLCDVVERARKVVSATDSAEAQGGEMYFADTVTPAVEELKESLLKRGSINA